MAIEPTHKHKRRADQAYAMIKGEIIRGILAADAQISEAEVSERLGFSRTPVREALIKLAEEGLVKIVSQVGTFVAPISVAQVNEAGFVREHLECALIVEAATRIDAVGAQRLHHNILQQEQAVRANDLEQFHVLDEAMHECLTEVAGYPTIWRIIQQSKIHMDRVRYASLRLPDGLSPVFAEHRAIVDAVLHGEGAEAQKALRDHLRGFFKKLKILGIDETAGNARPPSEEAS